MAKTQAAVLDFGSSKISVLIAERGINNTFNIKGKGEAEYAGFADGEFFDEKELKMAISLALSNAMNGSATKIKTLYVGVPAEFCFNSVKESHQNFNNRKHINDNDIYTLFDLAQNFEENTTHTVINRSPIYFTLDDGRRVLDPNKIATSKLSAKISFILAENKFVELVNEILTEVGDFEAQFMSSALAQSLFLLEPEVRDNYSILVDVGYITTSVSLVRGDGILFLKAFSIGGGHITGDLTQVLNLKFSEAESLKRKVVLSLDAGEDDYYETVIDGLLTTVSAKIVNEIIESRIDMVASTLNKLLNSTGYEFPDYLPVNLTGGGLSYLKGAKDYLGKVMGRNINVVSPSTPGLNRPDYSSSLGLLDLALKQEESLKQNFLTKLLNIFRK